jgi:succinate dehydrogenase/fumarate reductase flavoprotein subunit
MDHRLHSAEPESRLSRRDFLAASGAGAALAAYGGGPGVAEAAIRPPGRGPLREIATDVIIAGGGMGGLTAAVRAQRSGADVVLLEKDPQPGGTMGWCSEGIIWTLGSYEAMRNDAPDGDPALQRTLFETLPLALSFLEGVGAILPGSERSRVIDPPVFTEFMVDTLVSGGGTLLVQTPLVRLLTNERNEVVGVLAEGPDGPLHVRGRAVVVATGGWAGNAEMVNQHITRNFGQMHQRNVGFGRGDSPITGDGFWAASRIGAAPSRGGFDAFYGHVLPARPARFTHPLANYSIYHGQWSLALNLRGDRFADESRGRIVGRELTRVAEELIAQEIARQPEASAIYIWDNPVNARHALAGSGLGSLDKFSAFREAGAPVAMADTIAELAAQIESWGRGTPASRVRATVEEYNLAATSGRAAELPTPKTSATHALPVAEPPFFAVLGTTGITGTMGGLRVDPQGRVLGRTGRPITGLYAAGVDVGNVGNYAYMGMLCYGATFGFISGDNAARQPEPSGGWQASFVG